MPGGIVQGYSPILNLLPRWENGQLRWHNPETGRHIATFAVERARADRAEVRAEDDRARVDREWEARRQAEARARELQARLDRMGDQ